MADGTLQSRVAVVTGASAGIGLSIVRTLVGSGARVVLNARRGAVLDGLVQELGPDRVASAAGDCAEEQTIGLMLDTARHRFGVEADTVIVNAGRGLKGSVTDSDPAQWEDVLRTNVLGAMRLCRAAAARMTAGKPGPNPRDVVLLGSVVGRHVSPFSSMYGATKFAVHGLAEGLRRELGPKGVRVSLVAPGFVTSEFQGVAGYAPEWYAGVVEKIGPVLSPEDVARTVRFIIEQPPHCHVAEVIIRPTRQDYP
ncbi:MAG: SDR family oxidoreductase [Phycisphaerales bacterium]